MAFTHSLSSPHHKLSSQIYTNSTKPLVAFPKLPLKPRRITLPAILCCTSPKPSVPPATEQDILEAVAESDGSERTLPAVRTYENDLARLTVVGAADFQQSLTAAAADGGQAADEHIASGMPAMVVETVFPGSSDDHSTVSTRLFLPARKVKEKARRLKSYLKEDILVGSPSKKILAVTFRQVIIHQLWNFELLLFKPGTERNMDDLENPREVPASFALSSSDDQVISVIAEVICLSALESSRSDSLHNPLGTSSWFQKPKKIVSKDSSVVLYNLLEHEIVANAKSLLKYFISERTKFKPKMKSKNSWWAKSVQSKLEKVGGPEFAAWLSENVPCFRLQIDADKFANLKFEGWKELPVNRWEVLLTHYQMVGLADILDMYYEDVFTLPNKQLSCGAVVKSPNLLLKKNGTSLLKMLLMAITSGLFLVTIGVLGQIYVPHLSTGRKVPQAKQPLQSTDVSYTTDWSVEPVELEAYCVSIIQRVKDSFGWPGEIMTEAGPCAWTGELPLYLRRIGETGSSAVDNLSISSLSDNSNENIKASAQEIASFQVVLSVDGKIVGFQPTSRVAVNQWAANPLARELYHGRSPSPGLIEPGLKINRPSKVVAMELLMSANPGSHFALVRPLDFSADS